MRVVHVEDWPEQSLVDLRSFMVLVWTPKQPELPTLLAPTDVVKINGQPLVVVQQVSREEYVKRVTEAHLINWLGAPAHATFYEVTSD